jgi:hypothetical protein
MTHLELRARIGPDGILILNVPVGISAAIREVKVIVEPAESAAESAELTPEKWARFVDETAGDWKGELERPAQGEPENRAGGLDLSPRYERLDLLLTP